MEKMPYREELDMRVVPATDVDVVSTDWRSGLPALAGQMVTLRELRASDAASLFALLKMGTVREAVLRQSFAKNGRHLDQALFTILERDWRAASTVGKEVPQTRIH